MDKTTISFCSPKGGAGRTMVATNVAAAYVKGCSWAGLTQKTVLLVDADLAAPGCHYYPFISSFSSEGDHWTYKIKNKTFSSQSLLLDSVKKNPQGLLYLLYAIGTHAELRTLHSKFSQPKDSTEIADQNLNVYQTVRQILASSQDDPLSSVNPWNHVIQLIDGKGNLRMLLLPAGDPEQDHFQQVLDFDWKPFFEQNGTAVLQAIYSILSQGVVLKDKYRHEQIIPPIERILLDQEAGLSLPSVGNRLFANRQVIVSGLNAQNQDGLFGLLGFGNKADIRIVLSQYQGLAAANVDQGARSRKGKMHDFQTEDRIRTNLINKLEDHGVSERNVFLADFVPDAINKEFLARPDSRQFNEMHYFNEIIRLIVSIEAEYRETKIAFSEKREIRLLGEFVGIAGRDVPNGPLGAFREWASQQLATSGCSITGVATGHEEIAEMAKNGVIYLTESPPESENQQSHEATDFIWPKNNLAHLYDAKSKRAKAFALKDFDIVAIPAYLLLHVQPQLTCLKGEPDTDITSSDCVGPLHQEYFSASIKGWHNHNRHNYTHVNIEGKDKLLGYPLFVESQLIAFNKNHINEENFGEEYFNLNFRRFRGFNEPADVLMAARSARVNKIPNDRLIMTLKENHIAKWYEWQTVLGIFGACDFEIKSPYSGLELKSKLTDPKTITATRIYLELCDYAEKSSNSADWDKAIAHFFKDQTVGMAFIWPDSIPREYREAARESIFQYAIPPGDYHYEECWLLTIPTNRRTDAPTTEELERLLQLFLTYDNQLVYHSLGGVSVHRRALQSPKLWKEDTWLPEFLQLELQGSILPRMASPEARNIALEIVHALEQLRVDVKKFASNATDIPWGTTEFSKKLEKQIEEYFSKIAIPKRKAKP